MAKRGKKEKDNGRKNADRSILNKKNFNIIFSVKGRQRSRNIFMDLNDILKTIRFTVRRTVRGYPGNNQYL